MTITMTIDVTYRVVTPLFCASVDQDLPELRLPSFKGVLRYWWRALAWARYDGDLRVLRRREDRLFGSADAGQSRILLRLTPATNPETVAKDTVLTVSASSSRAVGDGARYLGYGLMEAFASSRKGTRAGQLQRACLRSPVDSPFDFTVQIRARGLDDRELASLTDALIALGMLGGMGARSRRGYGSLALQSLRVDDRETWHAPTSADELCERIAALRPIRNGGGTALPAFTAVSNETRHVLVSSDKENPVELLDLVGREFVRFRSWGHRGTVFGQPSERNFEDDHDLMKDRRQRKTHPRRIAFGLPHNYGKRDDEKVGPWDKALDRRASPLFIHLHRCGGQPVAVLSFLPARFLPAGRSDISVGVSRVAQKPEAELYRPVHEFLDRLLDPRKRTEHFTRVMEVPR